MGLGGFFKGIGKGLAAAGKGVGKAGIFIGKNADKALPLVQLVGIPIPGLQLIKAAMLIAEAKGGPSKIETAIEELIPALEAEGIKVPIKKLRLAIELLLDSDTDGMEGEDEVWTFDVDAEVEEFKRRGAIDPTAGPRAIALAKAAGKV